MHNSPFERLYNKKGILKKQYHYLSKRPFHKEKTRKTKERMRQFMAPEEMHKRLTELLLRSKKGAVDAGFAKEKMENGMTFGDFCVGCILARWAN